MIELDRIVCWAVPGFLLALVIQYWLLRLAVRGGIEDAARRQQARAARAAPPVWNLQQSPPQAEPGLREEAGT